ncbi:hypothetical protein Sru01_04900 [Sphaerisporangium rufum]|uniref:Bacterial transcriptional activator domain-containing protein n=1 Tax=Sphaerisporangium rufum TaxID=1381558 RepID=A0A919UZE9_9ACTN|nr:bacterial transcriptional activator domain-containing protein [Sphaerisporangium rufum]GII75508.1 hypothetical protein Sru01_04900 [Sphaerisporangium rufum]
MATPPVRVQGRSATDILLGVLAVVALLALVAGVPYGLIRVFGSPLPEGGFSIEALTRQVGVETIIDMLSVLVWLAWLQLVVCVLVELWSGVRRVGVPARVPFARGTQAVAHRLVTAALLLFTATAAVAPIVSAVVPGKAPAATVSVIDARAESDAGTGEGTGAAEARLTPVKKTKKVYVVQPPRGRHHESLWEIAEKCLGEGRRYREIYKLNEHREQPDGSKLHIASLIRIGWVLDMPDDATGVHVVSVDEERAETLERHPGRPEQSDGRTDYVGGHAKADRPDEPGTGRRALPDGTGGSDDATLDADAARDRARTPLVPDRPTLADGSGDAVRDADAARDRARTPVAAERQGADDPQATQNVRWSRPATGDPEVTANVRQQRAVDAGPDLAAMIPDFVAAGSLAAAGLLAALGRRRREQLWARAFGRRLPVPTGEAALAQAALMLAADAAGSRLLDVGLRHLSKELAAQGRTPPAVFGAFLAPTHIDLWIHPGDKDVPAPWTAVDDGRLWRLSARDGHLLSEQAVAGVLAPYPGLVSIGTNDGGRVLIDLETAHGLINLTGPPEVVSAALAAVAVELATNRWSDHMRLVLVGFAPELAMVAPDRITVAGSLAEALPGLAARTEEVRRALAAAGTDSVLTGRARGGQGEAWMPTYLLSAVPPTAEEAARLAELARTGTRLSSGYLVAGDGVPGAVWTWEVAADGRAGVRALGFDVAGQLLPEAQYARVIELFRATGAGGVPLPEPEPGGPAAAQLRPSFRPAAEVLVLGPVRVLAPRSLEEGRVPLCSELLAYLATHPGGVHPNVLGGALWPRGVETSVRDATIARAQEWLGTDGAGRFNLYADAEGRLHLGPEVRVDWQLFLELVRLSRRDPAREADILEDALTLVRGPLMAGRPADRYVWAAADPVTEEVTARVSDAARRLCALRRESGDPEGAIAAALGGLRVSEGDEGLWRDLLRAAHATGDQAALQLWVGTLRQRAAASRYWGRLVPETEALIEELLPSPVHERAAG